MDMWPFGKKEGAGASRSEKEAPLDRVMSLSSQGLSEPEIIRTLKGEGYSPVEVDSAMRNVLKNAVGGVEPKNMEPPRPPIHGQENYPRAPGPQQGETMGRPGPPRPDQFEDVGEPPRPPFASADMERDDIPHMPRLPGEAAPQMPPQDDEDLPIPPRAPAQVGEEPDDEEIAPVKSFESKLTKKEERRRAIEELIESVVDEKWNEVRGELSDLENRIGDIDSKLSEFDRLVDQMKGEKKSDLEEIETKIDSYKQSMTEVSSRMESVERAMKDSLTPMLQSLRSLSDTIKTMKQDQN